MVPFGFVLANPEINAVAGAFLIFSFVGTGSSFLAFAIMASKQGIDDPVYSNKSLYYMTGLTEGSETILCFMLMCIFPAHFVTIACVFGAMCWFTTGSRIYNASRPWSAASDKLLATRNSGGFPAIFLTSTPSMTCRFSLFFCQYHTAF